MEIKRELRNPKLEESVPEELNREYGYSDWDKQVVACDIPERL